MEMHNNIPGGTPVAILYARCFHVGVFFFPPSNVGLRRLIYPGALQFYRGVNKLFYRRTVVVLLVYVAVYYVLFLAVMCVGRGEDEDDS